MYARVMPVDVPTRNVSCHEFRLDFQVCSQRVCDHSLLLLSRSTRVTFRWHFTFMFESIHCKRMGLMGLLDVGVFCLSFPFPSGAPSQELMLEPFPPARFTTDQSRQVTPIFTTMFALCFPGWFSVEMFGKPLCRKTRLSSCYVLSAEAGSH